MDGEVGNFPDSWKFNPAVEFDIVDQEVNVEIITRELENKIPQDKKVISGIDIINLFGNIFTALLLFGALSIHFENLGSRKTMQKTVED